MVLALVYYECPMLCTQVLNGLVSSLGTLQRSTVGKEFDVVTVSFDPTRRARAGAAEEGELRRALRPARRAERLALPDRDAGVDHARSPRRSASATRYDQEIGQFAHAAAIVVLTPKGTIARYFYGIEYSPRDLRLGLVEAADERIGSLIDELLLFCYHYDPATGKYGRRCSALVRVGGVATVLGVCDVPDRQPAPRARADGDGRHRSGIGARRSSNLTMFTNLPFFPQQASTHGDRRSTRSTSS